MSKDIDNKRLYPKCKFFRIFNIKRFFLDFGKVTAWPGLLVYFKPKYYYQDKKIQNRRIKGRAVISCNHTSFWDPVFIVYTFFTRRLRFVAGEILFEKKKSFPWFIRQMGCIKIDRNIFDYQFMKECSRELNEDGVVGMFPEGALNNHDNSMKAFKSGIILMALKTNSPIIPMYVGGKYGLKKRQKAIIGIPFNPRDYCQGKMPTLVELDSICEILYEKECELKAILDEKIKKK